MVLFRLTIAGFQINSAGSHTGILRLESCGLCAVAEPAPHVPKLEAPGGQGADREGQHEADREQQQRDYVARIVGQYGAAYDIFFKPHPADTSSASYEADFPGLTLLPGQMPFEIFVWSLMDHVDMIGGYPSTVFLTVPVDKVRFIFAPDAESLVRPLNLLFRDAANVEWMQ